MNRVMLTVSAYAEKYDMPEATVYSGLYTKRICGERTENGWLVADVAPPLRRSKTHSVTIREFSDYELSLIWMNGTITDDGVILRSMDGYVPSYFADKFDCALWRRDSGTFVCKISSVSLVYSLREMGYTGRKDHALPAPDVDRAEFAAAFVESRSSFVRNLRYDRSHPMDKRYAYYVPAVSMCASYPIMQSVVDTLYNLEIIPRRKLSPAANQYSATIKITSYKQLDAIQNELCERGRNAVFWDAFDHHIKSAHQPYYAAKGEKV